MKTEKEKSMATTRETRHGKHHPDKVQFGGMVTPEFKAMAQLTANKMQCSLMELMQRGINNLAVEAGVMKDGQIVKKHLKAISAMADIIRTKLTSKRNGD